MIREKIGFCGEELDKYQSGNAIYCDSGSDFNITEENSSHS
jgi:hypothetical protein